MVSENLGPNPKKFTKPLILSKWGESGISSGRMKSEDIRRNSRGEGDLLGYTDTEERKHGEQTGLDTPLVHAVNDECCILGLKNNKFQCVS